MIVNGTKYQTPFALAIGKEDDELKFGEVVSTFVDGLSVIFEFIPMVTHQSDHHYHAIPLAYPPHKSTTYLIKYSQLPHYHPLGLYYSMTTLNSTLLYVVLKSNIYM